VILVNRDQINAQSAAINFSHFATTAVSAQTRQLANLNGETFVSATRNALAAGTVTIANIGFTISLPKLSVTAVLIPGASSAVALCPKNVTRRCNVHVSSGHLAITLRGVDGACPARLQDMRGKTVRTWTIPAGASTYEVPTRNLARGAYFLHVYGFGWQPVAIVN
jgi:hypothetical protein